MLVGLGSAAKRKTAMALATTMATPAMGFVLTEPQAADGPARPNISKGSYLVGQKRSGN